MVETQVFKVKDLGEPIYLYKVVGKGKEAVSQVVRLGRLHCNASCSQYLSIYSDRWTKAVRDPHNKRLCSASGKE